MRLAYEDKRDLYCTEQSMHEPTKELAALKYALTKETRLVFKTPYHEG